nr:MAG TPA: hypothetical protein [Caudoviricetes sp.]
MTCGYFTIYFSFYKKTFLPPWISQSPLTPLHRQTFSQGTPSWSRSKRLSPHSFKWNLASAQELISLQYLLSAQLNCSASAFLLFAKVAVEKARESAVIIRISFFIEYP